jgi:5-carboxyvanillate decarboxylase
MLCGRRVLIRSNYVGAVARRVSSSADTGYLRIATEEAFAPPELLAAWSRVLEAGVDAGFRAFFGFVMTTDTPRARFVRERLQDLGDGRLADMDATGIDRQILSIAAPGPNPLPPDLGVGLARIANDQLVDACQRPSSARSSTHTSRTSTSTTRNSGRASIDLPLYLHPNTPSKGLIEPMLDLRLEGAIFGFAVETGLHLLRLIVTGVFDRFPSFASSWATQRVPA